MALDPVIHTQLIHALAAYLTLYPEEADGLKLLREQLDAGEPLNDRRHFRGHITGSGILISPDRQHMAMVHHNLFDRWQQLGGHWEETERDPLEAARRETIEEAGISEMDYLPFDSLTPLMPLDIDTHEVPAQPSKDEPVHFHHDLRYVFLSQSTDLRHEVDKASAIDWFPLGSPQTAIVHRAVDKLQHLLSR